MASQSIDEILLHHRHEVDKMREEMDALRRQMREETNALRRQMHDQRIKLEEQDRVIEQQKKEIRALKYVWILENRCCIQHLRTSQATAHSTC